MTEQRYTVPRTRRAAGMAMTLRRLCVNWAIAAMLLLACGQANSGSNGEVTGGNGGHGASLSSGGNTALGGSTNSGGSEPLTTGGAAITTGGSSTAAGGDSAGQTQTSGGRLPTGGVAGSTGGKSAGGAGGKSSGGAATGGHSGGAQVAGAAGLAGAGGAGGARECPLIKCAASCAENWLGLDGCPTCTCAPPTKKLSVNDVDCPSASVTMTASSSFSFGAAVDRWLFDFEWSCSEHSVLGEPLRAHLQVALIQPLTPAIDASNRTFFEPRPAASVREYEVRSAEVFVAGSGVPEIEGRLDPSSSFLSIRLENGLLVGGLSFTGEDSAKTLTATMAGPFSVPVPMPP